MFERILELFFHAKAGALAGLILIGTTGALVTATVSSANNVTTITLTQASASPSGSASPSVSPATRTASPSPTVKPTNSPSSSPASAAVTTTACTADTQAMSDAVKTVNAAFSKYHTDLMHMRNDPKSDAAKKIVDDTDKLLKTLRQNAVKDIHATSTCPKAEGDEEDTTDDKSGDQTDQTDNKDENDDSDKTSEKSSEKSSEKNFVVILFNNLFGKNTTTTTTSTTTTSNTTTNTTLVTTGDPKAIAEAAVAAMKLAFDDAAAKLQALPSASPKPTKSPKAVSPDTKGKNQNAGKGGTRADREGGDD